MNPGFIPHNSHLNAPNKDAEKLAAHFFLNDPHLQKLSQQPLIHIPNLLNEIPENLPGIYTLSGSRQIGKTTFLKQWMHQLLKKNTLPQNIHFLTGELILDHLQLIREFETILKICNQKKTSYLIIDEITYIKDWDKGVKYLADAGLLTKTELILTGSDLLLLQEARMRLPGRRGSATVMDFHYYPLSFSESVFLKTKKDPKTVDDERLNQLFEEYMIHGGFLTAMNDFYSSKKISDSTYAIYSDWIRGDILKKGKQESYLQAVCKGVMKRYGTLITWNGLAKEMPIEHQKTIHDYVELLQRLDVCLIFETLLEDKLIAAPKKGKKIYFKDPFIFQALAKWLNEELDVESTEFKGMMVESIAVNHVRKKHSAYLINAEGEVDIAIIQSKKFLPIEVKWTNQIRSKDLKQIRKYKNGVVWAKQSNSESVPPHLFLPRVLLEY